MVSRKTLLGRDSGAAVGGIAVGAIQRGTLHYDQSCSGIVGIEIGQEGREVGAYAVRSALIGQENAMRHGEIDVSVGIHRSIPGIAVRPRGVGIAQGGCLEGTAVKKGAERA